MSERATRPLNSQAVQAADDELYSNHAGDPRPNALYDEKGNRKPLDANDPDQAGLRTEWMNSYKANGGKTEPIDLTGSEAAQPVRPCDQRQQVDPIITGTAPNIDESHVPPPPEPGPDEEPESREEDEAG